MLAPSALAEVDKKDTGPASNSVLQNIVRERRLKQLEENKKRDSIHLEGGERSEAASFVTSIDEEIGNVDQHLRASINDENDE